MTEPLTPMILQAIQADLKGLRSDVKDLHAKVDALQELPTKVDAIYDQVESHHEDLINIAGVLIRLTQRMHVLEMASAS